jgi:hypothetical protein
MKEKIKKFAAIFVAMFIVTTNFPVFAAEPAEPLPPEIQARIDELTSSLSDISISECKNQLGELYDLETLKFLKFLETNFQNKSSASSLTNNAIAAYTEYKKTLNGIFATLTPKSSNFDTIKKYSDEYDAYTLCFTMTDSYLAMAKEQMLKHIKNNNAQKETTVLLEKFQNVNGKLRDLNMEIAQMYSFFATFRNKLPGFLKDCLTQ